MGDGSSFDPRIPELTSCTPKGKRYKRTANVLAEIRRMLDTPLCHWLAEAPALKNETLVFMIGRLRGIDEDLRGRLMEIVLDTRAVRIIKKRASRLDHVDKETIVMEVQLEIYMLLAAETPSRSSEALELAFARAVIRRTKDAVDRLNHTPFGKNYAEINVDPADRERPNQKIKRPIEFVVDTRPNQLDVLLQEESPGEAREKVLKALDAVEDDQERHAWILRHCEGLPIHSKDPDEDTVACRLCVTPRRAKYLVEKCGRTMRAAAGVSAAK